VRRAIKRKEEPSYQGNFSSARRYVLNTFATTETPSIKKRVSRYMVGTECPLCHGKRLRRESLSVKFAGFDIADISRLPLARLAGLLRPNAEATALTMTKPDARKAHRRPIASRSFSIIGAMKVVMRK
jgi:excinuclease ABC subunit A